MCCGMLGGFALGYFQWGFLLGIQTFFIVTVLALLEISISFDNAIVNTTVLKKMDEVWRKRFLTRWIAIAVFGMRIIFPLLIVALFSHISPWLAVHLAFADPEAYALALSASHTAILWFGGAFLLMVWCRYFFDVTKEVHWIPHIEKYLIKMGRLEAIEAAFVLIVLYVFWQFLEKQLFIDFFVSGVMGVVLFIFVDWLGKVLEAQNISSGFVTKASAMAFVYLEILDASFSLDGVIGAFALSKNLLVIALWLWIGAFFVRSMTIYLFEKWTLQTYAYLEHGAFWAICALAFCMFLGSIVHIPEIITWLISIVIIIASVISSVRKNSIWT